MGKASDMIKLRWIIACILLLCLACRKNPYDPGFTYGHDMYYSVAYESYSRNSGLRDSATMQAPVEGTVNRQFDPNHFGKTVEDRLFSGSMLEPPKMPDDSAYLAGRALFRTFCINCHGEYADGRGNLVVNRLYLYSPARLNTKEVCVLPEGNLYNVITNGYGLMGAHGGILMPDERWLIVQYIKYGIKSDGY